MLRKFLADRRGNYAMITGLMMAPLMGAIAVGVDYAEMNRQYQYTQNALDAAGIATAHRYLEGADTTTLDKYATSFFDANLGPVDPKNTTLNLTLPDSNDGGGTLTMSANLVYHPYFYPTFLALLGKDPHSFDTNLKFNAITNVRLKDTLEVALVLDNSGSMSDIGKGSGKEKIDLLKSASKELIQTLVTSAAQVKQVDKPVQFGIVPFAASVNVGSQNANASWMDTDGISPIHHENFNWATMKTANANKRVELAGGIYYKKGSDWGAQENQKVTRFTLYNDLQRITGYSQVQTGTTTQQQCTGSGRHQTCKTVTVPVYTQVPNYGSYASWAGCVEQRPSPYDVNDAAPDRSTPATLFVPMFAPDETDNKDSSRRNAMGNWWNDNSSGTDAQRQAYMPKYYTPAPNGTDAATGSGGPNASCTTQPITPLTDVTNDTGMKTITDAVDAMQPNGGTNVVSGMGWGWRVVSSGAPFTEGRPESQRGNDKVVIVLTDGANTYYTPSSLGYNDLAGNKSIYADYGYTGKNYNGGSTTRLFMNTDVSKTDFSNDNYTKAMAEQMATLCTNAKAANIIMMTVSLDLDPSDKAQAAQMAALKTCASDSRFRMDPATGKPAKLYWNATGGSLSDDFKAIADELSNLRIVG
ncbi:MAG: pilus assembly protein TadG-related protein [Rhizobiaceae bacterium]|jgi:Flp pilus assembly protein TadG